LFDPSAEKRNFSRGKLSSIGIGRGHQFRGVFVGEDPGEEFTLIWHAWYDGGISAEVGKRAVPLVEAQVCLPFFLVRSMAEKAFV
jgi:hypothetical protein